VELPPGTPLDINGRLWSGQHFWYRVRLDDGRSGFVRHDVTRELSISPPAPRAAAPAPAALLPPSFIPARLVDWKRRATPEDLADAYPRRAYRNRRGGTVGIRCVVEADGSLGDCVAERVASADLEFADAGLSLVSRFRMNTVLKDGSSAIGRPYRLEVVFDAPER
jgi:TonB family protein